jgi:DNA-binding GntR family transcriptional regulator
MAVIHDMARAAGHNSARVGDADIAFHELLVELADSPRLSRMHQTLITETRMCIHALEETYSTDDIRVEEHRAIAQSFLDRKPKLTDRLLIAHMKDAVHRLTPH